MVSFHLFCAIFLTFSTIYVTGDEATLMQQKKKGIQMLVFGGKYSKITDAPYMAVLFANDVFVCGACIVHERFILTAAHCYNSSFTYHVQVGTDMLGGGDDYEIERIVPHPKYVKGSVDNDVAVIKLRSKLKFNERVQMIKMAPRYIAAPPGAMMRTMGFGETEILNHSNRLLIVEVPYIPSYICRAILRQYNMIYTDRMLCAGGKEGEDSCRGDSGGPLVYKNQLVGLVSFGIVQECGSNVPAVYANIPALRDFIDFTIRVNNFQRLWW